MGPKEIAKTISEDINSNRGICEGFDDSIINQWKQQFKNLNFVVEEARLSVSGSSDDLLNWLSTVDASNALDLGSDMAIESGPIFEKSGSGWSVGWIFY